MTMREKGEYGDEIVENEGKMINGKSFGLLRLSLKVIWQRDEREGTEAVVLLQFQILESCSWNRYMIFERLWLRWWMIFNQTDYVLKETDLTNSPLVSI